MKTVAAGVNLGFASAGPANLSSDCSQRILWLAEMLSAESGALLSRPSGNFELAFDQAILWMARTSCAFRKLCLAFKRSPPTPCNNVTCPGHRKTPVASHHRAGYYADGPVTDPKTWTEHESRFEAGAKAAGKDASKTPVLVEQYVVVGEKGDAGRAADESDSRPAWRSDRSRRAGHV